MNQAPFMTYTIQIDQDITHVFLGSKWVAKFDTDTFLSSVISPLEFRRFERNPYKRTFDIRKLEFELYKLNR